MELPGGNYLVVEDEPWVARTYQSMLEDHGVAVIVPTLATARRALQEGGPWSGFLIDARLPDGSGLRLLPAIHEKYPDVPVLIISAAVDGDMASAAFDGGASCVGKPLTPERLSRFLAERSPRGNGRIEHTLKLWGGRRLLTSMETGVLRIATQGLVFRAEIAKVLRISPLTVKTYSQRLLGKTGFTQLAVAAIALLLEALDGRPRGEK